MKPTVSVKKTSQSAKLLANLRGLTKKAVYVGIPTTSVNDRIDQLLDMTNKLSGNNTRSKNKKKKLITAAIKTAANQVNNAELLYIFSKGSPVNNQPPRPVIEPAIIAKGNKEAISYELGQATKAQLDGNFPEVKRRLKRAGMAGQNASRKWFTDSRNNWAPNSPVTIAAKGSDVPGIDTAAMRKAITYVVKDDTP